MNMLPSSEMQNCPIGDSTIQSHPSIASFRRSVVSIYALAHFLIDFCSAALVFGSLHVSDDWKLILLLYNFCAFALQMPIGLIADRFRQSSLFVMLSCVPLIAACILGGVLGARAALVTAILAGIGNGLFHIGGGIEVLNVSRDSVGPLGVFVAPGALGVFLGTLTGKQFGLSIPVVLLLFAALAAVLIMPRLVSKTPVSLTRTEFSLAALKHIPALTCLGVLFLVVCLRSYMGMALPFPWKGEGAYQVVLVCALALGKAAGGILADRLGLVRVSVGSLLLAAALLLFPASPFAGIAAVFLINTTMPVTLWALSRIFPGAKGFSFGVLTFALFLGFVAVFLGLEFPGAYVGVSLVTVASAALLFLGLRRAPYGG